MTMVTRLGLSEPVFTTPIKADPLAEALSDLALVRCVRGFDGWVMPDGLAPRPVFERLVEQGVLEAWPGRPLYRVARPATSVRAGDAV
ncbi:MAG TPA: hypothetical protein VGG27_14980 [Magnetospirillaceae bacterium]|jgi:hypothetical protein